MHFLLHSAALIEERLRQRLASVGVQHRQARVVDALARIEPATQVALAREFGITPASMSTMTGRLIEAGYISRTPHPEEARSNLLRLTDTGRGLLNEIHTAWSEIDALIEEELGTAEARALSNLTRALRDSLGGHVPGTAAAQDKTKETS